MTAPDDFQVDFPRTFEVAVGRDAASRQDTRWPEGAWVKVEGGDLPVPVVVRIDQSVDGRFAITGLMIGAAERREITWTTLRKIKPASIISAIFAGWDPYMPDKVVEDGIRAQQEATSDESVRDEVAYATAMKDEDPTLMESLSPEARSYHSTSQELVRALIANTIWKKTGGEEASDEEIEEVTRPRASVATNLTKFAETYRRNYLADSRRATTATANELHISRATAIRRIAECRRLNLLPPKGIESSE